MKLSQSRVSSLVFNHGGRITRIRAGRDFTVGSYERALLWFSDHWPEGLHWPVGIERPPRSGQGGVHNYGRVAAPRGRREPG